MRALAIIAGLTAVVCGPPNLAGAAGSVHGTVEVRFMGSSTLHEFSGSAPAVKFSVEPSSTDSWAAIVDVPVAGLTTENGLRDRNMRGMLHADEHPEIHAEFANLVPADIHAAGRLPFRLTIAGVTRDVDAAVTNWQQGASQLDFDAGLTVSLSEFGLQAPRALFIGVDDPVRITTHVTLTKE